MYGIYDDHSHDKSIMPVPVVDMLVLGATGFTGKLITRTLLAHRERGSFTFAIAGRSKAKLVELAASLELPASVQIFTVDVTNVDEVDEVVQKTKVVINTVGPYFKWSKPVVGACARLGIHYVDLSGETVFVQDIIDEFNSLAIESHSIIIPSCGFDSIPSDLMVYLSAQTLAKATQGAVSVAQSHTSYQLRGGISGGSIGTSLSAFKEVPLAKLRSASVPFAISPLKGAPQPGLSFVYTVPKVPGQKKKYGSQLILSPHNIAVVQRTWGLLQQYSSKVTEQATMAEDAMKLRPYGEHFTYGESNLAGGPISAALTSFAIAMGVVSLLFFPPLRWLVKRMAPKPGEGPSEEDMQNGSLEARNITVSTVFPQTKKPIFIETTIFGKGDPGHTLTATMIVESALALLEPAKLTPIAQEGGILTPMATFGDVLIERLKATGRFEIESKVIESAPS